MNVLSLFSGIGGLDLGLERAGMTIAGQVEIDPWCRRVLAKHWPEVPRHDDVRTCAEWWGDRRSPDLVAGGFPCQPTSAAGKREVQADSRWLWPAFAATIRALRPRYVVVENPSSGFFGPVAVKDDEGGLVGYGRAPIEDVLGDLATLGYDAEWDCIPAVAFGAPHIRDRVFIVAYPGHGDEPDRPRKTRRQAGERAPERPIAGSDGPVRPLADTTSARCETGPRGARWPVRHDGETSGRPRSERLGSDVANAPGEGSPDRRSASSRRSSAPRWVEPQRLGWWAAEPGVGRVAHGIPARVDRLRGLGNAVVPQVAEHIGRMIMAAAS